MSGGKVTKIRVRKIGEVLENEGKESREVRGNYERMSRGSKRK